MYGKMNADMLGVLICLHCCKVKNLEEILCMIGSRGVYREARVETKRVRLRSRQRPDAMRQRPNILAPMS